MKQENVGKQAKRITFLMPYIDFCFMLIIIFVGMLSIAYFEPLGATNIETKQDLPPDNTVGLNKTIPPGIEQRRAGTGSVTPLGTPRPLISNDTTQQMMFPTPNPLPQEVNTQTPAQLTATAGKSTAPPQASTTRIQGATTTPNRAGSESQRTGTSGATAAGSNPRTATRNNRNQTQTRTQGQTQSQTGSPVDTAALLEQLRKMQEEIEKLKAHQGEPPNPNKGLSDHLYLDLRTGQE